jgi:hypothetical protein
MSWTYCRTLSRTDEPSAHPWHQTSIDSCIVGTHFQVDAGIQFRAGLLDPAFAWVTFTPVA